jgi:hypothetical protein
MLRDAKRVSQSNVAKIGVIRDCQIKVLITQELKLVEALKNG